MEIVKNELKKKSKQDTVNQVTQQKKYSYEELENIAHQLSEQSRSLAMRLQQAEMTNIFKRLDYLFKVLEYSDHFDLEWTKKCEDEIVLIMTPETISEEEGNTGTSPTE